MQEFDISRISVGTIFKLVGVGLMFSLFPFMILMGCTAALGMNSLLWNNQPITGWPALVAAPFIGLFLVAFLTMFLASAISFGLWIYSLLGPFSISYKPFELPKDPGQEPN
jgi:hypothetical protein